MKIDKFVFALIGFVLIAWLFPLPATGKSGVVLGYVSSAGISLIFFFYGLKLSFEKMMTGLKNWRLHLLVQSATFIIFPLIILPFYPLAVNVHYELLWLGMFFLAALPSTVSSSVVMVSIARGNIPAAIFNASISGIIGIIVTPLWMGLFLQQTGGDFDFGHIYLKLLLEIILPVALGIVLQPKWHRFALKYSRQLSTFDKSVIILIVYKSFAVSFAGSVFSSVKLSDLVLTTTAVTLLFFLLYGIVYFVSRILKFNREDKITALFCGSKKSLVHGTVFSNVLFGGMHATGIILLPLMLFHAIQIFIVSIIASRYGRQPNE